MIALLICQTLATVEFLPPLLFVGEEFSFMKPAGYVAEDAVGVSLSGQRGVVKRHGAEFWLTRTNGGALVDAALVSVPVARAPRWRSWPTVSGASNGTTFIITEDRQVALVPMRGNLGICLNSGEEWRYANIVQFDVAVRSGPRHVRKFTPDVIYSGSKAITIYAKPDNVLSTTLSITTQGLTLTGIAMYALKGSVRLLGRSHPLDLKQGERFQVSELFTER